MSRKISNYFPKLGSKEITQNHQISSIDENDNSLIQSLPRKQFYDHKITECRVMLKDIFKSNVKLWKINLESQILNQMKEKSPENIKSTITKQFSIKLIDVKSKNPRIKYENFENIEIESSSFQESAARPDVGVDFKNSTEKSDCSRTVQAFGSKNGFLKDTSVNEEIETRHSESKIKTLKIKLPKKSRKCHKTTVKNQLNQKSIINIPTSTKASPSEPISSRTSPPSNEDRSQASSNIKHEPDQHFTIILSSDKPQMQQPNTKIDISEPRQLPKYTKFRDVSDKFTKLGPKQFLCSVCRKIVKTEFNLGTHLASHTKIKPKCDKCQKSFHNRRYFDNHICEAISKFCDLCKRSFSYTTSYRLHMKKFHPNLLTQQMMECDICGDKFFRKYGVKFHMETKHVGKYGMFICDYDGKKFSTRNHILMHMMHHMSKRMKCDLCSTEMKAISYKQHLVTMHNSGEFKCKICPKKFKNFSYLKLHIKYHEKRFKCDICCKKYGNNFELARHVRNHHENPKNFICICGRRFASNHILQSHMKDHFNRPTPFKCQVCTFGTDKLHQLQLHTKANHKLEKKIYCVKCGMNFRSKKAVAKHLRHAHLIEPFECDFCSLKFKRISNVYRHIKKSHNHNI